jgi:hypothetical protein
LMQPTGCRRHAQEFLLISEGITVKRSKILNRKKTHFTSRRKGTRSSRFAQTAPLVSKHSLSSRKVAGQFLPMSANERSMYSTIVF